MGHYEDRFFEIYEDIQVKGLKNKFDQQLEKMKRQKNINIKTKKKNGNMLTLVLQDQFKICIPKIIK